MKKAERELVYNRYDGHCGYCGMVIAYKDMHVDHIKPIYRNCEPGDYGGRRGTDCVENYMPACKRCNLWKATFTVEEFRNEIQLQIKRLIERSSNFRMALDFGLLSVTSKPVRFFFEKKNQKSRVRVKKRRAVGILLVKKTKKAGN